MHEILKEQASTELRIYIKRIPDGRFLLMGPKDMFADSPGHDILTTYGAFDSQQEAEQAKLELEQEYAEVNGTLKLENKDNSWVPHIKKLPNGKLEVIGPSSLSSEDPEFSKPMSYGVYDDPKKAQAVFRDLENYIVQMFSRPPAIQVPDPKANRASSEDM